MATEDEYVELTEYLRNEGHSDTEIDLILDRVRLYDTETRHDSIMDLIGKGSIDLVAIVKEALG